MISWFLAPQMCVSKGLARWTRLWSLSGVLRLGVDTGLSWAATRVSWETQRWVQSQSPWAGGRRVERLRGTEARAAGCVQDVTSRCCIKVMKSCTF